MVSEYKPKPCPFCGEVQWIGPVVLKRGWITRIKRLLGIWKQGIHCEDGDVVAITCHVCNAKGGYALSISDAILKWNRRNNDGK